MIPATEQCPTELAELSSSFSVEVKSHLHGDVFDVALALFSVHLTIVGCLIVRSASLPPTIGAALALAGACYLVNSGATFLSPSFARRLFPYILLPGFLAEGTLTLWLLLARIPARVNAENGR